MPTPNKKESWEERFDKEFHVGNISGCIKENPAKIKSFIRSEINAKLDEAVGEMEELQKPHEECYLDRCEKCEAPRGYNAALSSAIERINKLRE